jgi:hypothetical protein
MADEQTPKPGMSDSVKVALIGAAATVLVGLISGIFALMSREPSLVPPTATPLPVVQTTVIPPTSETLAQPTVTAITRQQPITSTGFLFATQITPDGIALDPAITFTPDVEQIYAVFQAGRTPRGLQVSHPAPQADYYYAYLEPVDEKAPVTIGWRWFFEGELVNEYETTTDTGYLWLSVFSQGANGLFEGVLGPAGVYEVAITIAGNPVLHAELLVEPSAD